MTPEADLSLFDQLLAALQHSNPHVRAGAAIALGKMGDARAIEPLVDTLEDPVHLVYTSAEKALGMIGSLTLGSLMAVIQDPPSLDSASRAYEALRRLHDPQGIDLLTAATHYDEKLIRWGAIEVLGNLQTEQALPALIEAAHHPEENTRQLAVTALGKIGHPDGIHAITAALNEADWQMRNTAVRALGRIGTEDVILPLLASMRDAHVQVRETAAQMLQTLRIPQASEILLTAVHGTDAWTRRHLARALGEIGDRRALPLLENLAVNDDDVQVRLSAAQALAKMGIARGETVILRTLNAPSAQTRTLAAIALGNIGNPKAISPLLENDIPGKKNGAAPRQVSNEIVFALHRIGAPAIPALLDALTSPDRGKQETAFKALAEIGHPTVPHLLNLLQTSAQPPTRHQVLRLLGMAADPRAVEPLADILRRGVASTFSLRGLVHAVYDPTAEERKLAADALGHIGETACAPPLLSAARYDLDREVRERASRALAALGDAESVLLFAQPQVFGEVSRSLISLLVFLTVGFVMGAFAQVTGDFRWGLLTGLLTGAFVGVVDGWVGQKRMVRGVLTGAGAVVFWGVFAHMFEGSPPLSALMSIPLLRLGAAFFGVAGGLTGIMAVSPFSREFRVRFVSRGCMLVILPVALALVGALLGGVAGAVLVLRADDPAFFQWFGGIALGILLLITWMQRGKRLELQKGLLVALGLLIVIVIGVVLSLGVPVSFAVCAPVFPIVGALFGVQSLPLIRRLAGLFGGMIAGFVGAGLGAWLMGMVK